MAKEKLKGTTDKSLYGKTKEPLPGTIVEVWRKDPGFDHKTIQQWSYWILSSVGDDHYVTWFNTFTETKFDGSRTPEYIGDSVDLGRNTLDTTPEKFRMKGATKKYDKIEVDKWPPACLPKVDRTQLDAIDDELD